VLPRVRTYTQRMSLLRHRLNTFMGSVNSSSSFCLCIPKNGTMSTSTVSQSETTSKSVFESPPPAPHPTKHKRVRTIVTYQTHVGPVPDKPHIRPAPVRAVSLANIPSLELAKLVHYSMVVKIKSDIEEQQRLDELMLVASSPTITSQSS